MKSKLIASIAGLGTALPEYSVSQNEAWIHASKLCCKSERQVKVLQQLYKKTTIENRASVLVPSAFYASDYSGFFPLQEPGREHGQQAGPSTGARMRRFNEEAAALATVSAARALENAEMRANEITHLVTVSCTGFGAPGFDLQMINKLAFDANVYRTNIGFMGCHGAMNALRVASGFCAQDQNARVLVNATELCSLHFQYGWQTDNLLANSLFADGSASIVLRSHEHDGDVSQGDGTAAPISVANSRSWIIPNTSEIMSWQITDNGFVMKLGSEIADLIHTYLPGFLIEWLSTQDLALSDVAGWCVHPGGPRILDAVESSLNLHSTALTYSRAIFASCGNMSSPTVLFILQEMIAHRVERPYVMLGFGPGLTIEAALFY